MTAVDVYTRHVVVIHNRIGHAGYFLLHLAPVLTHETLDGVHRALRVRDGLTLGRITHLTFATVYKCYYGRSRTLAFAVRNHYRFVTFKYGYTRIRSS